MKLIHAPTKYSSSSGSWWQVIVAVVVEVVIMIIVIIIIPLLLPPLLVIIPLLLSLHYYYYYQWQQYVVWYALKHRELCFYFHSSTSLRAYEWLAMFSAQAAGRAEDHFCQTWSLLIAIQLFLDPGESPTLLSHIIMVITCYRTVSFFVETFLLEQESPYVF